MLEADAARVLLVRAIEEHGAVAIDDAAQAAAFAEAGDCDDVGSWFARRAASLLENFPRRELCRAILQLPRLPDSAASLVLGLGFAVGVLSNELGPSGKIHILFNPILALVAWNLVLYVLLLVRSIRRRMRSAGSDAIAIRDVAGSAPPVRESASEQAAELPWLFRMLIAESVWQRWLRWRSGARAAVEDEKRWAAGIASFLVHWVRSARELTSLRIERLLHLGALGLVSGAVAGMYIRGLFFDYNVVWRSTFIRSESAVSFLLSTLLGPAAAVLRIDLASRLDFRQLTSESGVPAAQWIHLYALTALVVVAIPRLLLWMWESGRIRRLASAVQVSFADRYFQSRLHQWRESRRQGVLAEIRTAYLVEVDAMAEDVGEYVCANLFDASIRSELARFRENGGRLTDLELRIQSAVESFSGELAEKVRSAQQRFESVLTLAVEKIISRRLGNSITIDPEARRAILDDDGGAAAGRLVAPIGDSLTDAVGLAVSGAVAIATGTISGGFGKAVGVAVLVGVVHSGPLAFVIGAVGGLVAAGAGLWFGREAITAAVKEYELPGWLAATILSESRMQAIIDDGREKTRDTVRTQVTGAMSPHVDKVAEEIWQRIDGI
ncbi:MAG TPA: DUF2868 domain-containing protein [Candidatus Limnocylindrales bacterium]|nr:DUF2868 domain-containing protein [Candidatus Limnocylindrales bacterium]